MKNLLKYILMIAGMIGASNSVGTKGVSENNLPFSYEINNPLNSIKESNLEKTIELSALPPIPHYKGANYNCSKYVRLAGKDLYGKKYAWVDSWDRRYADSLVAKVDSKKPYESLKALADSGVLKPGMVVGLYTRPPVRVDDPNTPKDDREIDIKRKFALYTHNALYVGIDSQTKEMIFYHEWGNKQKMITLKEMKSRRIRPMEIIDAKEATITP